MLCYGLPGTNHRTLVPFSVKVQPRSLRFLLLQTPIDDNTKTLLLAAVGLVAVSGLLLAGRAAVISMQEKLSSSITNVAVTGAFGVLVVLVAIAVLEN